jgi:DNA-binding XRE family transcriptional regulator
MNMLNELLRIQRKRRLTDTTMAEKLGISRIWWNYIKNGKRQLTDKTKRSAYNAFPEELRDIFLADNFTPRKPQERTPDAPKSKS